MNVFGHEVTVLVKRVYVIRVPLDEQRISECLKDGYWRVKHLQETNSTQAEISDNLDNFNDGDLVISEFQSAGRGRLARTFIAPAQSSLLFSFLYKPKQEISAWGWLSLLIGVSITETLNREINNGFSTKWPNDVLFDNKKVAGILCEKTSRHGVIVGIGINVNYQESELPVPTATSLNLIIGKDLDRTSLFLHILADIKDNLTLWESNTSLIREKYMKSSSTLNSDVRVILPNEKTIESKAVDIDHDGALILDSGDVISAGDVIHLR